MIERLTDRLEHFWEEVVMKRMAGTWLVIVYLVMIGIIELNRQGWLPPSLAETLPESHFFAVEVAFTLLLMTEVVSLIFSLTRSFSRSIGVQFEILSLILLRDTFKKFTDFGEPLQWSDVVGSLSPMALEAISALVIFVILHFYYRMQQGHAIAETESDQLAFIRSKKLIALGLLLIFIVIGIVDAFRYLTGMETYPFFETFYTVLIFTDVLMVLLSMRYSYYYTITFRNFGYAVVTVFIRISLIAPPPINGLIGIGSALFAVGVAYAYNIYVREMRQQDEREKAAETAEATA